MQTQVVHQPKATVPWIPALVAALLVFATAAGVQIALRDRGATVLTSVDDVTGPGVRDFGPHGAARIPAGEENAAATQKAAMVQAGVTSVGGSVAVPIGASAGAARQKAGMVEAGVTGLSDPGEVQTASGGPHPRTKFGVR